jgi:hypothetical protein
MQDRDEGRIVKPAKIEQCLFDMSNSPVVQAPDWSPFTPYNWQQAIWMACWGVGRRVAVRTCNESGKTSCVVPMLALSWAAAFPGSQVVVTSASERQFEKQLMPTFDNMIAGREGWRKVGSTIYAPSQDGLPPSEIVCFATKSGNTFEGFHNRVYFDADGVERYCPLLIIADEAKTIKNEIFTAIERCNPVAELRISTCGEDTGGHYDACMDERDIWTKGYEWRGRYIPFKIPWTDCPHLLQEPSYTRKMAMLQELGPGDPIVCSILMAEFFRSGDHMVFESADLLAIQDCQSGMIPYFPGQRRAFCDISGGGDELTFGLREGNKIHPIVAWTCDPKTPPSEKAVRYVKLFNRHSLKPGEVYADNGGLGAEVISEIEKIWGKIIRVNFGKGAEDSDRFKTRVTELHWEFKSLCHSKSLILPIDAKFYEQARKRRYTMKNDDSGCINLEDKKKAKRERQDHSPDRLETIICLLMGREQFVTAAEWQKGGHGRPNQCGTIAEFWAQQNREEVDDDPFGGGWGGAR